jgi:hypothetical protein
MMKEKENFMLSVGGDCDSAKRSWWSRIKKPCSYELSLHYEIGMGAKIRKQFVLCYAMKV